jgi:hypothetical protein
MPGKQSVKRLCKEHKSSVANGNHACREQGGSNAGLESTCSRTTSTNEHNLTARGRAANSTATDSSEASQSEEHLEEHCDARLQQLHTPQPLAQEAAAAMEHLQAMCTSVPSTELHPPGKWQCPVVVLQLLLLMSAHCYDTTALQKVPASVCYNHASICLSITTCLVLLQ